MQSVAAYDTGKLIAKVGWQLAQASLSWGDTIRADAHATMDSLVCVARGMLRRNHDKQLLNTAIRTAIDGIDSFIETQCGSQLEVACFETDQQIFESTATEEIQAIVAKEYGLYVGGILHLVEKMKAEIEALVAKEQGNSDVVLGSFHFGVFTSEALYAPDIDKHIYREIANSHQEWYHAREHDELHSSQNSQQNCHTNEPTRSPIASVKWSGFERPPTSGCQKQSRERANATLRQYRFPGGLPVPKHWLEMLKVRWQEFGFGALPGPIMELIKRSCGGQPCGPDHSPARVKELIDEIDKQFHVCIEAADHQEDLEAILNEQPHRVRLAYRSWLYAKFLLGNDNDPNDKEAYDCLKDSEERPNELKDYVLPAFQSWSRYVRIARAALGRSKNTPRVGRPTGKSVVKHNDVERPIEDK